MHKHIRLGLITIAACLVAEALSYAAYFQPLINPIVGGIIVLAALLLSLKDLRYGLLILAAELVIGSQGYLFSLSGAGGGFSLRIALWIIIMAIWLLKTLSAYRRDKTVLWRYLTFRYARPLVLLAAGVILGISVGLLAGNDLTYLFLDGKRWMFALVLLPFLDSFCRREELSELFAVSAAAALWLSFKTLLLVFIFSHSMIPLVYDLYGWMRLDLLGEITRLPSGFSRVFMQSQIYLIPLFFAAVFNVASKPFNRFKQAPGLMIGISFMGIAAAATLTVCLSRSFWVAVVVALGIWLLASLIWLRNDWKRMLRSLAALIVLGLLGVALVFAVVRFPYPKPSALFDGSLLSARATQLEAGAASRWSLLPVLGKEALSSPLWGKGFGATVTYKTSDPRVVLFTTNGMYTTYAFEWGWLDLWLKTGIIGVMAYLWLFVLLLRDSFALARRGDSAATVIGLSVIALAVVHFFTPYLNHPLGFGYLIAAMLYLSHSLQKRA